MNGPCSHDAAALRYRTGRGKDERPVLTRCTIPECNFMVSNNDVTHYPVLQIIL